MIYDMDMIRAHYETYGARVKVAKAAFARPLTLAEKILFAHLYEPGDTLESVCTLTKNRGPFYFIDAKGYVDGKLCVSAELSFALIPNEKE